MDIEKLKRHIEETSVDVLRKEWVAVKEFADVSPLVNDFIQIWEINYLSQLNSPRDRIFEYFACKNNLTETPNKYSGFFYTIAL